MRDTLHEQLMAGLVVPYLGPGVLTLVPDCPVPTSAGALVTRLTARAAVPHKIRNNLTAAAQFIENFKHRKTITTAMTDAFAACPPPTPLHRELAALPRLPLLVHAWYDDLPRQALAAAPDRGRGWGMVQGVSQAEHFGEWNAWYAADGRPLGPRPTAESDGWDTLLYQPLGSVAPAGNYLVSDSDFVEVLTEIDIQTPIPAPVRSLRAGRGFLFLGCRFSQQLDRIWARQIMKRSSDRHWAVLPEAPTRNEQRFLEEQNIERIDLPLDVFLAELTARGDSAPPLAIPA